MLLDIPENKRKQESDFSATAVHRPSRPMLRTPQVHDLPEARGAALRMPNVLPSTGLSRDKISLVGRTQSATHVLRLVPCA